MWYTIGVSRKERRLAMAKKDKYNWAVFDKETGFRLTEYKTRNLTNHDLMWILKDQPELRKKIEIRQRGSSNGDNNE